MTGATSPAALRLRSATGWRRSTTATATGSASAATAGNPTNGPVYGCVFQTINGHYLTAVGGGRTTDTIHTDATRVAAWEKFTVSCGH